MRISPHAGNINTISFLSHLNIRRMGLYSINLSWNAFSKRETHGDLVTNKHKSLEIPLWKKNRVSTILTISRIVIPDNELRRTR